MEFNLKTTLLAYPQVGTLPVGGIQEVYLDETTWELVFKMVDGTLVKASLEKGIELITQEATDRATENIKRDITPLIDKLREDLEKEILRATTKENELNNSIILLSDKLQEEIARAIAEEQKLHQEIVTETQRATTRENELEELIGNKESSVLSKLQEEITRATTRENELDTKIDTEVNKVNATVAKLDSDLNFEIRRATAADFELTSNLNKEILERKSAILVEQTVREQEDIKINKRIDDLTTHTDTSIQDLDNKFTNALNTERQERVSADNTLTQNLNNEKKLREDADKVLTDNLNKEIQDRQNAITQLDTSFTQKLNEEIKNREKAVSDLGTKLTKSLSDEVAARENADNALTERVTNEVSTLNSTISALDIRLTNAITTETNNRIEDVNNARQEATTKIEEEKQARELADNNLTKALEKETLDRTTADNDLSRRVDNLEGKTTRLFYGEGTLTSPNATQIQSFIDGLNVNPPYTAPYSGIAIVVHITSEDTYHIWHYYDNLNSWRDDGIDTVSTFTNTTKGIIQGSEKVGYISAIDGVGKVNGWEELTNKVDKEITDRESAINNLNQTLTNAINEEARVRQEQDTSLTEKINKEVSDRQTADTNLINDELRFSKSRTTTVAVGGIPKGTTFTNEKLLNIINNMFFPYVAFSISGFTTTPNGGVYECGQTINVTNSNTTVSLGSENIKSVVVYDGQTKLGEKVGDFNASSFAIPITSVVTTNKNFKVEVKDDRTTLTRNSSTFTFVYPYYYGSIPKDTIPTQELVKGLTKVIQTKGNKTYKYTHSDACSVIAYPASYGELRLIKDQNNFDITSSFTKHTLNIVGLDTKEVSYNVYISTNSSVSNFGITFNY